MSQNQNLIKCPWCEKEFLLIGIIRHTSKIHNKTPEEYILYTQYNNVVPKCDCGCDENVTYHKKLHKFNRFIRGHQNKDPIIRQQMINGGRQAAQDPEKNQKITQKIKEWWANPNKKEIQDRVRDNWKQAMQDGHKVACETQEYKDRMSEIRTEHWASEKGEEHREYCKTDEFRGNVSVGTKEGFTDESRNKLSELASTNQALGVIGPNMTKRQWIFNPFTQQDEHFDSGWEVEVLQNAIKRNIPICRNKTVFIPYEDASGKHRRYVPDFLSLSGKTIIEVKGMKLDSDILKLQVGKEYCDLNSLNFVVFDSPSLLDDNDTWSNVL